MKIGVEARFESIRDRFLVDHRVKEPSGFRIIRNAERIGYPGSYLEQNEDDKKLNSYETKGSKQPSPTTRLRFALWLGIGRGFHSVCCVVNHLPPRH